MVDLFGHGFFIEKIKYKENYLKALDRMLKVRKEKGLETTWKTGEEVFYWWINL